MGEMKWAVLHVNGDRVNLHLLSATVAEQQLGRGPRESACRLHAGQARPARSSVLQVSGGQSKFGSYHGADSITVLAECFLSV